MTTRTAAGTARISRAKPSPTATVTKALTRQNATERTTTAQSRSWVKTATKLSRPTKRGGCPNCWARPYSCIEVTICHPMG